MSEMTLWGFNGSTYVRTLKMLLAEKQFSNFKQVPVNVLTGEPRQAEHLDRRFDGLLVLGGTMGTDLALDVANALPLGCPKMVLSTIAYSPLILYALTGTFTASFTSRIISK